MLAETKMDDCAALRAAYRAARAAVDRLMEEEAPEGVIFDETVDAEVNARDTLAAAPCANDDDFFANANCAREVIKDEVEWTETAGTLLENYLAQRRYASGNRP